MPSLRVRELTGRDVELLVDSEEYVHEAARRLAAMKGEKVAARLMCEGQLLPPGQRFSECELKEDVVEVIWCTWRPPIPAKNSGHEVLPRRAVEDIVVQEQRLEASGTYALREVLALRLGRLLERSERLRVVDVRQCGLEVDGMLSIFKQLPASLEELWASRNHLDRACLECLRDRGVRPRVLDVGYSECRDDMAPLIDVVGENTEELNLGDLPRLASCFPSILAKCPKLRSLDIYGCYQLQPHLGAIASCPRLRQLSATRVSAREMPASLVDPVLRGCVELEEVSLDLVSSASTVSALGELQALRVLQVTVTAELLPLICELKLETLSLSTLVEYWEADFADQSLLEEPHAPTEALKRSSVSCIALQTVAVAPMVLEAIGSRLCHFGPQHMPSFSTSVLEVLAHVPQCCSNLTMLTVNFNEQIDARVLAAVAAACPLLEQLWLNAESREQQKSFIDQGVLALGEHCHKLVHLDLYDRVLEDPATTLSTACAGWPKLRYLCIDGCSRDDWQEEQARRFLEALDTNCPELQELEAHDLSDFGCETLLSGSRPLYGKAHLDYDSD